MWRRWSSVALAGLLIRRLLSVAVGDCLLFRLTFLWCLRFLWAIGGVLGPVLWPSLAVPCLSLGRTVLPPCACLSLLSGSLRLVRCLSAACLVFVSCLSFVSSSHWLVHWLFRPFVGPVWSFSRSSSPSRLAACLPHGTAIGAGHDSWWCLVRFDILRCLCVCYLTTQRPQTLYYATGGLKCKS